MSNKPNPGSKEAVDLGCNCPVIDNSYGKDVGSTGIFYINLDCPLHGKAAGDETLSFEPGKPDCQSPRQRSKKDA